MSNQEIIEKKYTEAAKDIKEEWLENGTSKWYEYVIGLPIHLQIVYLVVALHNQVFNGGFHQYFVNGYGQFAKETINALIEIGANRKAKLLKEAFGNVNDENDTGIIFRERILKKDIKSLFVDDTLFEPLNKLDIEYYASEEDVEQLLAMYLQNR